MSDLDGAACNAALLAADALTRHAVGAGSEHFDPFKGASGVEPAGLWSDVYDRAAPRMSAVTASRLGDVLTDAMVADVPPPSAHSVSTELAVFRKVLLRDGIWCQGRRRVECVADVAAV